LNQNKLKQIMVRAEKDARTTKSIQEEIVGYELLDSMVAKRRAETDWDRKVRQRCEACCKMVRGMCTLTPNASIIISGASG
jgi:3'-phosphoadenosine 5'-phosphosulfate sulfotransferase